MGKITLEEEGVFVAGIGFLRGFLDLLTNAILAADGLENMDEGGFFSITCAAKEKLGEVEEVFEKLQNS